MHWAFFAPEFGGVPVRGVRQFFDVGGATHADHPGPFRAFSYDAATGLLVILDEGGKLLQSWKRRADGMWDFITSLALPSLNSNFTLRGATEVAAGPAGVDVCRLQGGSDHRQRPVEVVVGPPVDGGGAGGRPDEPEQHPKRGGLAGAVGPEEPGHPPRRHREAEVVDSGQRAEPLGQPGELHRDTHGADPATRRRG